MDSHIPSLMQENLISCFQKKYERVLFFLLPGGEEIKGFDTLQQLTSYAVEKKIDASWDIYGVGGGTLLDVVSFFSSLYHRGSLSFYSIPTTLLAMTDAAIGGKNGINVDGIKNVLGTISSPEKIFIIQEFLNSFSGKSLAISALEMWKHTLITSSDAEKEFQICIQELIYKGNRAKALLNEIEKSIERKLSIVAASKLFPYKRDILNLGHTVAHALESGFQGKMSHEVSVLYGIVIETLLGLEKGVPISMDLVEREIQFLQWMEPYLDLVHLKRVFNPQKFIDAMMQDKKRRGVYSSEIVLLSDFGIPYNPSPDTYLIGIEREDITWILNWMQNHCIWL